LRVDKYLWCVRLAKTRSIATEQVKKGKIRINGEVIKPSRDIKIREIIQVYRNSAEFSFRVIGLPERRVGAKLVVDLIEDITPIEEIEKHKQYLAAQSVYRNTGDGKPNKKDRRSLDEFLDNWE
jgi:ribosome-associated heat shock protein Hsp15